MSLRTFSKFYYGHEVTVDNFSIPFDEGSGELLAELNVGAYTLNDFVTEVTRALNAAGTLSYTLSTNRDTRIITITGSAPFELLTSTGTTNASAAWQLLGYDQSADHTGSSSYAAENETGFVYEPQFILQDHIDPDHWVDTVDASVNKSARGDVEVVTFGEENFLQCSIKYITDITQDGDVIHTNGSGVAAAVDFMRYIIKKNPIEFMEDADDASAFIELLLESTPESAKGTAFKLKELYDRGLPGYFETGNLKFRVYDL